jgi:hypothetical protein
VAAPVQALDDRALVGVAVGLDALPERGDVGVNHGGAADEFEHRGDPALPGGGVAGVEADELTRPLQAA